MRRLFLRAAIAVGVAVLLLVGPVVGQVFGVRTSKVYPKWRMFTGTGRHVCQVEYKLVTPTHTEVIDHHEVLRLPRRSPKGRALSIKRKSLDRIHQRMCWALGGMRTAIDLRVRARCGSRGRWVDRSQEDSSVCAH